MFQWSFGPLRGHAVSCQKGKVETSSLMSTTNDKVIFEARYIYIYRERELELENFILQGS